MIQESFSAFEVWAATQRSLIDERLMLGLQAFAQDNAAQKSPLLDAMYYGVMNGGKRVRALAVLAAGELFGAKMHSLLAVAAALEYIHAYSLIHDDLPCMDDDNLRRGQPTVHVVYGQAQALLAGDALQSLAFATLCADDLMLDADIQIRLIRMLAHAVGIAGMAGGQAIDLHSVGQELPQVDVQIMHNLKTGALLHASLSMGALCGDGSMRESVGALNQYAEHLGLLFQVVDDILDAVQGTEMLGKTAGKDDVANKPTYVRVLGLDGARTHAQLLYNSALDALEPYGLKAQRLVDLAAYCANRAY